MQPAGTPYSRLVLVCTNERTDGRESCGPKGGVELHAHIKQAVREANVRVRVSRSGCLDNCKTGPSVVIMPDNIWLGAVTDQDVPRIVAYLKGEGDALDEFRTPPIAVAAQQEEGCCGGGCCAAQA